MAARLQVKPEHCSPLGKLILQHMKDHSVSMNELAKKAGISQPGLRSACFKGTNPTDSTLNKLSHVLGRPALELYNLAHEGRLEATLQDEACLSNARDALVREIFETAAELGLSAPKNKPPKNTIKEALLTLGFCSNS
ncbi:helix-turn-helix transcriptional regulator [Trichocoleus sp. FACHB-262]|nr:helix-turn-helix transcriptional regulator [Trichocoleus sp. FACHB-262]MBD2121822.1 helix-turn-helix transcriptional regulator [Trichocoleus sp. FACHB-262]